MQSQKKKKIGLIMCVVCVCLMYTYISQATEGDESLGQELQAAVNHDMSLRTQLRSLCKSS